jgi:aryl-alcohol dehydrogenase-like predicted oxidoreductase
LVAQPSAVTAPIVSPRTAEQWTAVREAVVLDLDGEIMERISDLFPPSAVA